MGIIKLLAVITFALVYTEASKPGLQMRLTENGMKYAVDVGIKIMQEDLTKKVINEKGQSGRVSYAIQGLRISKADFGNYKLIPVAGAGMRGIISGITIKAAGNIWYKYKRGWFKVSDTIGVSLEVRNVRADLQIGIGADKKGYPTIDMEHCSAGVDDINLKFHGGGSWIYNIFRGVIAKQLKKSFGKLLCTSATEEINTRAKLELATFPVIKRLDKYAEIDYSLTKSPLFTANYMDAFIKGEFKSLGNHESSTASVPSFPPSTLSDRMIYFWVSDYTMNTAGEVYHKTGFLKGSFAAWDNKMSANLQSALNTKGFGIMIPKLYQKFPNAPMGIDIYTYKAPTFHIETNKLTLKLYTYCTFSVMGKNKKIVKLFGAKVDIRATAAVGNKGDNITGRILAFDYDAKVNKEYLPEIDASKAPLDSPLVKAILDMTVISKANPILGRGFPLPKINEVTLENFKISLLKDAIQIGTDVKYVNEK